MALDKIQIGDTGEESKNKINAMADNIDANSVSISGINNDINTIETDISNLESDVQGINTKVIVLETATITINGEEKILKDSPEFTVDVDGVVKNVNGITPNATGRVDIRLNDIVVAGTNFVGIDKKIGIGNPLDQNVEIDEFGVYANNSNGTTQIRPQQIQLYGANSNNFSMILDSTTPVVTGNAEVKTAFNEFLGMPDLFNVDASDVNNGVVFGWGANFFQKAPTITNTVAIGYKSDAIQTKIGSSSVYIGGNQKGDSNASVLIGYNARAESVSAPTLIGASTSVGTGSQYSVAIGSNSKVEAGMSGVVSFGSGTTDANYGKRRLVNVADPVNDQDAVTKKWIIDNQARLRRDEAFAFDGTTSTYALPTQVTTAASLMVYLNGMLLSNHIDYNLDLSEKEITFVEIPNATDMSTIIIDSSMVII